MQTPIRKLDHNPTRVFSCCYECHRVEFYPGTGTSWCWERHRHDRTNTYSWDHERCYLRKLYNESISPRFIKR